MDGYITRACVVQAALISLLLSGALSFPARFQGLDCTSQPTEPRKGHKAPLQDADITFTVLDPSGAAVTSLCGSVNYTVQVSFPQGRRALLTATQGTLFGEAPCPNRVNLNTALPSHTASLRLPCGTTGSVALAVTSAQNSQDNFRQSSLSLPMGTDCPACVTGGEAAVAGPSASPTPTPTPSPPTSAQPEQPQTNADPLTQPACAPSDLGYRCSRPLGSGLVLHWAAGGAAPPANPCTNSGQQNPAPADGPPLLHLAVTSPLAGYVALAFAARAGQMAPAQAVVGTTSTSGSGAPRVATLSLLSYTQVSEVSTTWASNAAVVRTSAGGLLLCFSVAASGLPAAASAHRRGRALAQSSAAPVLEVSDLRINWATDPTNALDGHTAKGGLGLNALTGSVSVAVSEREKYAKIHGALMSAAWGLVLPLGALAARHRWALQGARLRAQGLGSRELWLYLHAACQLVGMGLFVAGFAISATKMKVEGTQGVSGAHRVMGYVTMGLAGLQLLAAFARPAPAAAWRPAWNALHHNLGRLAVVVAWATLYMGVYLVHTALGQPLAAWLAPLAGTLGLLVGADVALTAVRGPLLWAAREQQGGKGSDPEMRGGTGSDSGHAAAYIR